MHSEIGILVFLEVARLIWNSYVAKCMLVLCWNDPRQRPFCTDDIP